MQDAATGTHDSGPSEASSSTTLADAGVALGLSLAALAAYLGTLQSRLYGDGPGLATMLGLGTGDDYHHVGYLPLARLFRGLLGEATLAVQWTSAVPLALSVGLLFLTVRRLGGERLPAALGAGLWATAPGTWFFATTAEVHAPHAAALVLALFAVTHAPWRRPVLATVLVAPVFLVLHWTHVSAPLLGLGLVLLVAALEPAGRELGWPRVLLGVGPAWLAALVLAMALAAWMRGQGFTPFAVETEAEILSDYARLEDPLEVLRHNLAPFEVLGAVALFGIVLGLRGRALLAFGALVLPSWIFFTLWGVRERGGYFLPTAALLAWPVALLAASPSRRQLTTAALVVLIVVQVISAHRLRAEWTDGWDYADRARAVAEALPEGGSLVVPWIDAPSAQLTQSDVVEVPIAQQITLGILGGQPPEAMYTAAEGLAVLLQQGPVAVDLSFEARAEFHAGGQRLPYLRALVQALDEQYATTRFEHGVFAVVRIEAR